MQSASCQQQRRRCNHSLLHRMETRTETFSALQPPLIASIHPSGPPPRGSVRCTPVRLCCTRRVGSGRPQLQPRTGPHKESVCPSRLDCAGNGGLQNVLAEDRGKKRLQRLFVHRSSESAWAAAMRMLHRFGQLQQRRCRLAPASVADQQFDGKRIGRGQRRACRSAADSKRFFRSFAWQRLFVGLAVAAVEERGHSYRGHTERANNRAEHQTIVSAPVGSANGLVHAAETRKTANRAVANKSRLSNFKPLLR